MGFWIAMLLFGVLWQQDEEVACRLGGLFVGGCVGCGLQGMRAARFQWGCVHGAAGGACGLHAGHLCARVSCSAYPFEGRCPNGVCCMPEL